MQTNKFSVLDEVKTVNIGNGLPITISIGIGMGSSTLVENYDLAGTAIDMALGRGGDQAVSGHAGGRRVLLEGKRRPLWDFGRARYYLLLQGTVPGAGSQAAGRQAHAAAEAGAGEDQPRRRHRPAGRERGRRQGHHCTGRQRREGGRSPCGFVERANGRTGR